MGSPVSSLSPYQFAFNGWIFGAGTNYPVESVDGLLTTPDIRVQDDVRGYTDGSYSGRDFYSGRTVTINFVILGTGSTSAQQYYQTLQQNLYPQQLGTPSALSSFQFQLNNNSTPGGLKIMYGRVRKVTTTIDPDFTYGHILASVEFYFPDPRYYDYPFSTVSSGTVMVNDGWAISSPVITVTGQTGIFSITDSFSNSMSFNATSGSTVVIDCLQRVITQNGNPNRSILATSTGWLYIPPMTSNTFTASGCTISVSWSPAYV